eukprot:3250929-Pyramimonas_sp.AAC.3
MKVSCQRALCPEFKGVRTSPPIARHSSQKRTALSVSRAALQKHPVGRPPSTTTLLNELCSLRRPLFRTRRGGPRFGVMSIHALFLASARFIYTAQSLILTNKVKTSAVSGSSAFVPFHLAIPVTDIAKARDFYGGYANCKKLWRYGERIEG